MFVLRIIEGIKRKKGKIVAAIPLASFVLGNADDPVPKELKLILAGLLPSKKNLMMP